MLDDAENIVYFYSFCIDLNMIKDHLIKTLDRGVIIYIVISTLHNGNRNVNAIYHQNLFINNQHYCKHKKDRAVSFASNMVKLGNDDMFGLHGRFLYNGKQLLLCGTNYHERYSGSYKQTIEIRDYYWYEHGLLIDCPNKLDTKLQYLYNNLVNIPYGKCGDSFKIKDNISFVYQNDYQLQYILNNIDNAKNDIYIENQYLHSGWMTNNKVTAHLIKRINKAIVNKETFHLTLNISVMNYDESVVPKKLFKCFDPYCIT